MGGIFFGIYFCLAFIIISFPFPLLFVSDLTYLPDSESLSETHVQIELKQYHSSVSLRNNNNENSGR